MKKPIHLFMFCNDKTYCGIPMMVIAKNEQKYSLTMKRDRHTCDECDKALGLYLLSET